MVPRHLPCYQMLPEAICLADRPFEPKEVDSFPVMVVLSTKDDGEPINRVKVTFRCRRHMDGENIPNDRH